MRIEDLVGKEVVRTKGRTIKAMVGFGFNQKEIETEDNSYTTNPIIVLKKEGDLVYYIDPRLNIGCDIKSPRVMQDQYKDDSWAEYLPPSAEEIERICEKAQDKGEL